MILSGIDADLSGVVKRRVGLRGRGKGGGERTVVAPTT
ncbi:type II toxin-antitoxin system RelE/ParE family toxin [Burkholderia plantarii]|nr:type II toxin-antitoxin system RelE/ParE family toxin [Burkholderia plantarii]